MATMSIASVDQARWQCIHIGNSYIGDHQAGWHSLLSPKLLTDYPSLAFQSHSIKIKHIWTSGFSTSTHCIDQLGTFKVSLIGTEKEANSTEKYRAVSIYTSDFTQLFSSDPSEHNRVGNSTMGGVYFSQTGRRAAWGVLLVHHNCHLKANTLRPRPLTGELKAGVKVTRVS